MKSDIAVFVHGLGGNSDKTWGQFPTLLSSDPDLSAAFDVGFFHFPADLFNIPFFGQKLPPIQLLARALATQLDNKYNKYANISLISHSLGGLIARKYILDQISRESTLRVNRLLMYATPNNGTGFASVAKYVSWCNPQLKQLCRNSDFIDQINESWFFLRLSDRLSLKYVVAAQDRIVDTYSAQAVWGNTNVEILIDRGHINCVKPESASDLSFLIAKRFLLADPSTNRVLTNALIQTNVDISEQIKNNQSLLSKLYKLVDVFAEYSEDPPAATFDQYRQTESEVKEWLFGHRLDTDSQLLKKIEDVANTIRNNINEGNNIVRLIGGSGRPTSEILNQQKKQLVEHLETITELLKVQNKE